MAKTSSARRSGAAERELREYRRKRRFDRTPEPEGGAGDGGSGGRFVIQEHHARRLHWDLRLERDGVLASWALPRGIPPDPGENRLAVHTEDHPLSYIEFEGEIPKGEYGAGEIAIWDRGTYEAEKFESAKVVVDLHGERVRGRYALFRTRDDSWMIHRMDPPDLAREPMPRRIEPMTATKGRLPAEDERHAYEIRWDGVRAIAYCSGGRVELQTHDLGEITARYPELRALGRQLGSREAVLDGEVVALDADERPSLERLERRMHLTSESEIRRRSRQVPVTYMIFDLLYLEGRVTMSIPYEERRGLLEELRLEGPSWQTPSYHRGDGRALLAASRNRGLAGIVAKRLDSPYVPGRRTKAWVASSSRRS